MKSTLIIPTYWTAPASHPCIKQKPDATYDHPTLITESGTLPRLLKSLEKLCVRGVDVPDIVVLVAVTHKELESEATKRTGSILREHKQELNLFLFSSSSLDFLVSHSRKAALAGFLSLLNMQGYSNVRNVGLLAGQILGSDATVFLDDDEVVTDEGFFRKSVESLGKKYRGKTIGGVTGYYIDSSGSYWLEDDTKEWWKAGWRKKKKMNEAFRIIEGDPRLKETTFAFGGNMALHRELFEKVPFDPYILRGEDMDMLVNARMFDFAFLLHDQLRVQHLPPYKASRWSEMRQDIYRFAYQRRKLQYHECRNRQSPLQIESLEPYPGSFLRRSLFFKFGVSNLLSAFHSALRSNTAESMEYLKNIRLSLSDVHYYVEKHYSSYFDFQRRWAESMPLMREERSAGDYLEKNRVK